MGFMLQLILVSFLVLTPICGQQVIKTNATSSTVHEESPQKHLITPKTERNTNNHPESVIDSSKNVINNDNQNKKEIDNLSTKLEPSEAYSAPKENRKNSTPVQDVDRKDKSRSIDVDINKYVSPDFHNKNNVYTVAISPETEKFIDPNYDYLSTSTTLRGGNEFAFTTTLTTPKSDLFDDKFRQAVESVDQKLEQIDFSEPNDSKEDVDVNKLIEKAENDKNANLDYIHAKHLELNETVSDKSAKKDTIAEQATKLHFESSYNDTKIVDEPPVNENIVEIPRQVLDVARNSSLIKPETSTVKNYVLTTRKSVSLTKPPTNNKNNSDIFNNRIEKESFKATERPPNATTKLINVTKRGNIKFTDTLTTTPVSTTKSYEQTVQENNIVTVKVDVPEILTTLAYEEPTTTSFPTTTVEEQEMTTIDATTEPITEETTTESEEPTTTEATIDLQTEYGERTSKNLILETTTDLLSEATTIALETTTLEASTTPEIPTTTEEVPITVTNPPPTTTEAPETTTLVETTTEAPTTPEDVERTTTSEIQVFHILTDNNHTTLHPETDVNPVYYPLPEEPQNKSNKFDDEKTETETIPAPTTTAQTPTDEGLTDTPSENKGTIAAIIISSVGAVCLVILAGLLYIMRKRQKRFNYGQRCRPVSLDDYSVDNVSVYNSVTRRKGVSRMSKRSYGNPAFEDPIAVTHPLNFPALAKFATNLEDIKAEYDEIPQINARASELPEGCEVKNRYANVIPLPETRVFLKPIDGYPNSDYINANYVTGPQDVKGYYIACQGPMQNTVDDFWRMVWEQQSKVVLMMTHLYENGIEKCADYLPPSEVLDCHRLFGDFQVTLKRREDKEKYIISSLQLKNMVSNSWREVTHFWYLGWPEKGIPKEANSLIAFLIEARSYMKTTTMDKRSTGSLSDGKSTEINPVVVHCSPGTGRTGVVIACDIAIREFEKTRLVDVPKIVYRIRRDRASSVQTREQYEFIYKVVSLYAAKLTGGGLDSI